MTPHYITATKEGHPYYWSKQKVWMSCERIGFSPQRGPKLYAGKHAAKCAAGAFRHLAQRGFIMHADFEDFKEREG